MTSKEYLAQGYRLEKRIKELSKEIEELRALATTVSSPGFEDKGSPSKSAESPFARVINKIVDMETRYADLLERLIIFKEEMCGVIDDIKDKDEHLVLRYRYLSNMTWVRIGMELGWDERSVRRIHNRALSHVVLPKHPTIVDTRFIVK